MYKIEIIYFRFCGVHYAINNFNVPSHIKQRRENKNRGGGWNTYCKSLPNICSMRFVRLVFATVP